MAEDEGVGLDFLTHGINVQWDEGLAVEFGDRDGSPPGDESETA
jgi:hypothetical protein